MKDIKDIKAAIFDIDGTLLDSSPVWENLGERFLASRGITPKPGINELLRPMTLPESCTFLQQEYHLPESPSEIQTEIFGIVFEFYHSECGLKPGTEQLLRELHRRDITLVLATAGYEALSRAALERLGIFGLFRGIVSCAQFGSKNHPRIYLKAAELAGSTPEQTAVFEDSFFAISTAKSAGFLTAAVTDISEPQQEKLRQTADYYRKSLTDYAELFA